MTVSEAKQTQRKAGRAARKALSPEERKAANAALCAFLWQLAAVQNAQTILLYAAFGSEADLSALAEKAQAQGKTLAYPVCGEAYSLTAAVPGPDGWEMGQYGIRTPILSRSEILLPEALDLVLVPCTAFDADCFRVGMGKGYYDRYLPRCKNAVKIGIAFEVQRVEHAAVDEHDQRLDAYVRSRYHGSFCSADRIRLSKGYRALDSNKSRYRRRYRYGRGKGFRRRRGGGFFPQRPCYSS